MRKFTILLAMVLVTQVMSFEVLESFSLSDEEEHSCPDNCAGCKISTICTSCDSGFYISKESDQSSICKSCVIDRCTECTSATQCTSCSFPYRSTGSECILRITFFVYVGAYTAVALVLGILSVIESRSLKKKHLANMKKQNIMQENLVGNEH